MEQNQNAQGGAYGSSLGFDAINNSSNKYYQISWAPAEGFGRVHGNAKPTNVVFDRQNWEGYYLGWSDGAVSSHHFHTFNRIFSAPVHPGSLSISQVSSMRNAFGGTSGNVASLSPKALSIRSVNGLPIYDAYSSRIADDQHIFSSFTISSDNINVYVGTTSSQALEGQEKTGLLLQYDTHHMHYSSMGDGYLPVSSLALDQGISKMAYDLKTNLIACGGTNGGIRIVDPRLMPSQSHFSRKPRSQSAIVSSIDAYSSRVTGMDICGNLLVACGKHVISGSSRTKPESFLRVFDIRKLIKQLVPVQCNEPPSCVQFFPDQNGTAVILGKRGSIRIKDFNQPDSLSDQFYQVQFPDVVATEEVLMTSLDISPSSNLLALADTLGTVYFWSNQFPQDDDGNNMALVHDYVSLASYEQHYPPPSSTVEIETPKTQFGGAKYWNPSTPENKFEEVTNIYSLGLHSTIGSMSSLLSTFPEKISRAPLRVRQQLSINPELKKKMTKRDWIGVIPNEAKIPSNSLLYGGGKAGLFNEAVYNNQDPRIDSASQRYRNNQQNKLDGSTTGPRSDDDQINDNSDSDLPEEFKIIENLGIKKQKTVNYDVDFGLYNKTQFAGLETDIPNARVCNSILLVLYFIPQLRYLLLGFISLEQYCLATEAGFLFHMLNQARTIPSRMKSCQARNFLRTIRLSPDANALGLLEPTSLELEKLVGLLFLFLLEQFRSGSSKSLQPNLEKLFGVGLLHVDKWEKAKETSRKSISMVLDLQYHHSLMALNEAHDKVPSFTHLLHHSFRTERRNKAWCEEIKSLSNVVQLKQTNKLPPYLVLNCASERDSVEYLNLWRKGGSEFLPWRFYIEDEGRKVLSEEDFNELRGNPEEYTKSSFASKTKSELSDEYSNEYELFAVISQICTDRSQNGDGDEGYLIAHVRLVDENSQKKAVETSLESIGEYVDVNNFLLFKDFIVSKANDHIRDFSIESRRPCVVIYRRLFKDEFDAKYSGKEINETKSTEIRNIKYSQMESKIAPPKLSIDDFFRNPLLKPIDNLPGKGDIVAIDCEFVALTPEEAEILPDGSRHITIPSIVGLARVSCVKGNGSIFIDDYIHFPEPVYDYRTRFSGLSAEDLDPEKSKHHLVSLKIAYLKLRYLVDRGCIFVGHGLDNDFKVINLLTPPEQIRDTVNLFYLPGRRKLSLRFLSSVVLKVSIQDRAHDSVEDAKTALFLYHEYEKLCKLPDKEKMARLEEIYAIGESRAYQ